MTQTLSTQAIQILRTVSTAPATRDSFGPGTEVRDALRELEQGGLIWNHVTNFGTSTHVEITTQGWKALVAYAERIGFESAMKQAEAMARKDAAYWSNIEQGDMPGFAAPKFRKLADKLAAVEYTEEV